MEPKRICFSCNNQQQSQHSQQWGQQYWLQFYKGSVCGVVRKYSDSLLMFLLKGARPDVYREQMRHEHAGVAGGPPIRIIEVVRPGGGS